MESGKLVSDPSDFRSNGVRLRLVVKTREQARIDQVKAFWSNDCMISRNCTKSVQMGQVWTELVAAWSSQKGVG